MKMFLAFALLICPLAALANEHDNHGRNNEKFEVCHGGERTIEVASEAVDAHMAHGDCLGSCPCPAADEECASDEDCSDGVFCNGTESCSRGGCIHGTPACLSSEVCLEDGDTCYSNIECFSDGDCSNEQFCDGPEVCDSGGCTFTEWSCPDNQVCDEDLDLCLDADVPDTTSSDGGPSPVLITELDGDFSVPDSGCSSCSATGIGDLCGFGAGFLVVTLMRCARRSRL